jgi:hypothetical protein
VPELPPKPLPAIVVPVTYETSMVLGYRDRKVWDHLLWDRDISIDHGFPDGEGKYRFTYLHVDARNPLDGPAPSPAGLRYRVRCRWEPGERRRIPGHGTVIVAAVYVGLTGGKLCWVIHRADRHA